MHTGAESDKNVVTSLKDPRLVGLRSLSRRAERVAAARCVVEGRTLIEQVLATGGDLQVVLRAQSARDPADDELSAALRRAKVTVHRVRDGVLRQVAGVARPVTWWAGATFPAETTTDQPWGEFAIVVAGVADPGNLGALVRSARALGVDDLVLTDADTDLGSRRVMDSSRGAVLGMRTRRFSSPITAIGEMRRTGFQIVATSPHAAQLQGLAALDGRPVALLVGGETTGLDDATIADADVVVAIPMAGPVESLNVSVAAGISMYELRTRMVLAMLTERIRGTIGRDLAVTSRLARQALDAATRRACGLSSDQVIALMVVTAEHSTPAEQLRRDLGVSPEELVDLLAPVVERGWLDCTDQATYGITRDGEQALATLWPVQQDVEQQLLDCLSTTERATLRDLLGRVQGRAAALVAGTPGNGPVSATTQGE